METDEILSSTLAIEYLNNVENGMQTYHTYIGYLILLDNGNILFLVIKSYKGDDFIEYSLPNLLNVGLGCIASIKANNNCFAIQTSTNVLHAFFDDSTRVFTPTDYSDSVLKDLETDIVSKPLPENACFAWGVRLHSIQNYLIGYSQIFFEFEGYLFEYNHSTTNITKLPYKVSNINNIFITGSNIYLQMKDCEYLIEIYKIEYDLHSTLTTIKNIKSVIEASGMLNILLTTGEIIQLGDNSENGILTSLNVNELNRTYQYSWIRNVEEYFLACKAYDELPTDIIKFGTADDNLYAFDSFGKVLLSGDLISKRKYITENLSIIDKIYYRDSSIIIVDKEGRIYSDKDISKILNTSEKSVTLKTIASGSYI